MDDAVMERTALDLTVGGQQEPLTFKVDAELNQQYLYSLEDFNLCYLREGSWGQPIVHPALLLNMTNRTRSPSFRLPQGYSSIHAKDETWFIAPARVGDVLTVSWTVVELYEHRGRPYQALDVLVVNQDGLQIMRRRVHSTISNSTKGIGGGS